MDIIRSVVCPVCGCLCDDIEAKVENDRICGVINACALGAAKFENHLRNRNFVPLVRVGDQLVKTSIDKAIKRSAEILASSSYPVLYGWSCTSCEAIQAGLELAEEIGGLVDNTTSVCHGPSILAMQEVGLPSCTLGQIRHRADLIIYWACNPWSSHPRHIERYTAFSEGRFRRSVWRRFYLKLQSSSFKKKISRVSELFFKPRSELVSEKKVSNFPSPSAVERRVVVVDVRRTMSAEMADYFLQVRPGGDYEVLQALRALVRDEDLDVEEVSGIPLEVLEEVADMMISCNFGVIFFGLGLTMSRGRSMNVEAAIRLTRELNKRTKFVIMPMRGHFNVSGANTVFTWQTGFPYAVDFSHGFPRYNPGETSVIDVLRRGDSDAALIVAADPVSSFPQEAVSHLLKTPLIVIDPCFSPTAAMADVVIPSAIAGIEAEGTAYRMDHVPLPLRRIVNPPPGCLPDEQIIRMILKEVRRLKGKR
ncbi:MAG: molybdopterin-dependent oxidoreductase [Nitrososphaerota archaeon]|nr:molybdopterin-dependent oxidoreductase [Nitrososphaerota archaeon]